MIDAPRADPRPIWVRWPQFWDVAVATIVVVLSLRVLAAADLAAGFRRPDLLSYLLTALGAAAIGWARYRPLWALGTTAITATVLAFRDDHVDVLPFVATATLFAVGSYLPRRAAIVGLALSGTALAATAVSRPPDLGLLGMIQSAAIFGVAWVLGRLTQARREALLGRLAAVEQQAATERTLAAYELDRAAWLAVEERVRIARELHDVLAHSISVISVQATVGEHLADSDPGAARQALVTIGEVSRSSMAELRQLLTLLRDADAMPDAEDPVSYEPARGLGDVDDLVSTYRAAGLTVGTSIAGQPHPLSGSADLCAYRIVQEALTNTLKHAGPSTAELALDYGPEALRITVHDDGIGAEPGHSPRNRIGPGHGLIGMRERTALLGGELTTGPDPSGGFTVTAVIPYQHS